LPGPLQPEPGLRTDRAFSEALDHPEITPGGKQACDLCRYHFAKL
jgi:hypothetical protein